MIKYLLGVLLLLVVGLSGTSCHYRSQTIMLEREVSSVTAEVETWKDKTQEAVDREVQANTRCLITQQTVEDVHVQNTNIDELKNTTLRDLAKQPHDKLLETIIDANQKPTKVADDAHLSTDAMRLLNSAYCAGAKNDSACSPTGTVPALPASKSRRQ